MNPLAAITGPDFAFSTGTMMFVVSGATGAVKASVKTEGPISSPVSDQGGDLYFSGTGRAYRVDASGKEVWTTPFGVNQSPYEFLAPDPPVLSAAGDVYVSALDGVIWSLKAETGAVVSQKTLGLIGGFPRIINLGFSELVFVERTDLGLAAPGIRSLGVLTTTTGSWAGEITDGAGWFPQNAFAGFEIGIVAFGYHDTRSETRETVILDKCGKLRWRVPGKYSWPVAITFHDDLIVQDRMPTSTSTYSQTLRRFSKDGRLLAGPVSTDFLRHTVVGADDTLIGVTCTGTVVTVVALNSALAPLWSVPLESSTCPEAGVLNNDGVYFLVWSSPKLEFAAIQTQSPGPADVSWSRYYGRDARGTFWLAQ